MRRGVIACGLALGIASCGAPRPEAGGWPEPDAELFFLLRGPANRPVEILGPFGQATESPERATTLELQDGDTLTAWVFELAPLAASSPRVPRDRWSEVELILGAGACPEGELTEAGKLRLDATQLPATRHRWEAGAWQALPEAELASEGASLLLPYDDRLPCSGASWSLGPFAAERTPLPEGVELEGEARYRSVEGHAYAYFNWVALAFLDADRILAASPHRFFIIHRARSFDPSQLWGLDPPIRATEGTEVAITDLRPDPAYSVPGKARLLVTYRARRSSGEPPPPPRGALRELIVGPSGIERVRTSTLTAHGLDKLAIDESGRFVVAGREGLVLGGHMDRGVDWSVIAAAASPSVDAVLVQDDPRHPFLIVTTAGHVLGLNLHGPTPHLEPLGPDLTLVTPASSAVWPRTPAGPEVWLSTFALGLRRRVDGAWSETTFPLPARAAACGGTVRRCGQVQLDQPLLSMAALADGRLLVGPARCTAAFLVSPDQRCVEPLALEGESIGPRSRSAFALMARLGERIALAGEGAELVLVGPRGSD